MRRVLVASVLAGFGCVWQGAPVPVVGDTRMLEGEWEGSYTSEQTGRSGSIEFRLTAGTDSAYGVVVMTPVRAEQPHPVPSPTEGLAPVRLARALRISFVSCEGSNITGMMDPYEDPDTGEPMQTAFQGRLDRATLRGTFTSTSASGRKTSGSWIVKRK